jgi:small-conductance mechanosensitive channel
MVDWTGLVEAGIWTIGILIICTAVYIILRRILTPNIGPDKSKLLTRIIVLIVGVMLINAMMVNLFEITLTVVLTSIGIIGVAVAFASQQIMQNAMAGMLISIDKRIKTNDWVEVGGTPNTNIAMVKDVQVLGTVFVDIDGREFIVPNSFLLANKVVNYTHAGMAMVTLRLTLPINNDISSIRAAIMDVARADGRIMPWSNEINSEKKVRANTIRKFLEYKDELDMGKDPFKPALLVRELSDDGYVLEVRLWSYDIPKRDVITGEIYEKVLFRLMQDGVKLYGFQKS